MTRGPFISLDGLDGAGKSTQCRLLADWLSGLGRNVVACHDPGGTDLGQRLRDLLLHDLGALSLTTEDGASPTVIDLRDQGPAPSPTSPRM